MKFNLKYNPSVIKMITLLDQWQKASLECDNETLGKLGKQRDKIIKKFNKDGLWICIMETKLKPKTEEQTK